MSETSFEPFRPEHVEAAAALSRAAGWPHRKEDWALISRLSDGIAVTTGGRLVGTAFLTPFGEDAATINMVIVDEALRGQGIGRRLMRECLDLAGRRVCHLVATAEGLPLYEKLGFVATGDIRQHQGNVRGTAPAQAAGIAWRTDEEARAACAAIDLAALGMDRSRLVAALFEEGRVACLTEGGRIRGYACLRAFGRGEVAGPIIAADPEAATRLLRFLMAECDGRFLRVDTMPETGLAPLLEAHGLAHAGGGLRMRRGAAASPHDFHRFALASQALG